MYIKKLVNFFLNNLNLYKYKFYILDHPKNQQKKKIRKKFFFCSN